ncbi:SCO6745 family protein [Rhodococcus sp. AB351]|uniref:SCO6745 family protein n=1 Tax=Rhodococcus sp. AB351 TaxID=3413280 RepID=UPI003C14D37E
MDPSSAGRAARALELLHSGVYFAPDVASELAALGVDGPAAQYFGGRAAPLGAVGPGVVTATFYSFSPRLVASAVPAVWQSAEPAAIIAARLRGLDALHRRVLGQDVLDSAEMNEAADLATTAARAIPGPDGRPLYAAHADLPWPEEAHLRLWHALTLLREYRGDGHIAALQTAGLSGLDALVTHTATGIGFATDPARKLRGWSRDEWADAEKELRGRGLLDKRGELTGEGFEVRELVEDLTDDLAVAPWSALGDEGVERLLDLALPWRDAFVDAEVFPAGLFGPRYGDAR